MKLFPLYSSSSGNLYCLEHNDTNILIDVGISYKNICLALESINKTIDDVTAILITHEHTDHTKGINMICKKHSIPIYTCKKTKEYLDSILDSKNIPSTILPIEYNKLFKIDDIEVIPFETKHDAVEPCGFKISDGISNLTFATDLGIVTENVMNYLSGSDYIVLEANYDNIMLEYGPYPFSTKHRIKSNLGHLSNEDSAHVIASLLEKNNNTRFLLSHISSNNNTHALAKTTITSHLDNLGFGNYELNVASKDLSLEEYFI